jgi:hypothetical protein
VVARVFISSGDMGIDSIGAGPGFVSIVRSLTVAPAGGSMRAAEAGVTTIVRARAAQGVCAFTKKKLSASPHAIAPNPAAKRNL